MGGDYLGIRGRKCDSHRPRVLGVRRNLDRNQLHNDSRNEGVPMNDDEKDRVILNAVIGALVIAAIVSFLIPQRKRK